MRLTSLVAAVYSDIQRIDEATRDEHAGLVQLCMCLAQAIDERWGAPAPAAKELRACLETLYGFAPVEEIEGDPINDFERRRAVRAAEADEFSIFRPGMIQN